MSKEIELVYLKCQGINCPKYNGRCIAYGEIPDDCPLHNQPASDGGLLSPNEIRKAYHNACKKNLFKEIKWLDEARLYVIQNKEFSDELKLFYVGLLQLNNLDAWRDYMDDYSPQEAIDEDMSYLD